MKVAIAAGAALALILFSAVACDSTGRGGDDSHARGRAAALEAWDTIYSVLQHPRCVNCHPSDGIPTQGDDRRPHPQNVQGGDDGKGRYALRCDACHLDRNLDGAHLPPGAPNWHLPPPEMPLVFAGRSSGELCRQLKDRAHNGGRSPEAILDHLAKDPLVLWGWSPGVGRTPVSTPHDELLAAVRAWIEADCGCP